MSRRLVLRTTQHQQCSILILVCPSLYVSRLVWLAVRRGVCVCVGQFLVYDLRKRPVVARFEKRTMGATNVTDKKETGIDRALGLGD